MTNISKQRMAEIAARDEIYQLVCTYMRGQDRLDREIHRSVFWDDAWCVYGTYNGDADGFVDFAQSALTPHLSNHHMIGQVQIEVDGDTAWGEVYYNAFHRVRDEDGVENDMVIAGRYVDRYECRDDVWKIIYRSELVDFVRSDPAADAWFKDSAMILGARKPDDPLYHREAMVRP